MNSRDSSKTHTTSEFTAHAAVLLKQYYRDSWFDHNYDATSPLGEYYEQLNTKAYDLLKCEIHKTFPQCDILKIQRIHAPQMYGMYLLHKAEMRLQANGGGNDIEKVLYHVTAESNAVESLISGLDWRRNQRPRFGSGVSFSNDVDYSNYHANQSTNKEGTRVIIVSTVLMNDTHVVTEKWLPKGSLIIPPGTADTTVSPNGHVFVKYNDFESYPMFFVYYRWSPELRNESKFFVTNNNNLQKLQQLDELQTLCQQVADICIGAESISQQRRLRNSSKKRRKQERRAAVKSVVATKAEAKAVASTKAVATVATLKPKQLSQKKTVIKSRAAAKAAAAEVKAAATKAKATAKAKIAAAAKVAAAKAAAKAVAAAKLADAAEAKAAAAAKVAAAAEAKSIAAAKAVAAAATPKPKQLSQKKTTTKAVAAAKVADAAKAKAAAEAKSATATPKPKKLSQKKLAVKSRERRRRRAAAKIAAAEVDGTAGSVMTTLRQ